MVSCGAEQRRLTINEINVCGDYFNCGVHEAKSNKQNCEQTLRHLFVASAYAVKRAYEIDVDNKVSLMIVENGIGFTPWGCIDIVSAGTGEMRKRYGFIYVDRDDEGKGDFSRSRKKSFFYMQKVYGSNGADLD